ncbi:MAG: methenyltetrahydromethanopterin cyclohydrolase [Candidatus Hydrothermarchaeaceae archaeon]
MNLNPSAAEIAREMMRREDELGLRASKLSNGAKIVDCGVNAPGSFEAARLFIRACMGGLAEVKFSFRNLGVAFLPCVQVWSNSPVVACLASQKAGWRLGEGGKVVLGSGPARILARKPRETFEKIGYDEKSEEAVIALETISEPTEDLAEEIANACGVKTENLYILIARTSSLVGSSQISARAVEVALFKMASLEMDFKGVLMASAATPIAPVVGDDFRMMGASNDMVIYGATVYLVHAGGGIDVDGIPSTSSPSYGKPFLEIFQEAGGDFYNINPEVFAPAEIYLNTLGDKKMKRAGRINTEVLLKSIGLEG